MHARELARAVHQACINELLALGTPSGLHRSPWSPAAFSCLLPMMAGQNPYAAPAADQAAPGNNAPPIPTLLPRLWVLGLGLTMGLGGLAALAVRALAWDAGGGRPRLLDHLMNIHADLMVFTVFTGAVMACAVFAATRLGPLRLAGPGGLGIGAWAAWLTAIALLWLPARGSWTPIALLVAALLGTAAGVAWAALRPERKAFKRELWLAFTLALACAALALAFALLMPSREGPLPGESQVRRINMINMMALYSAVELIAVAAAVAVAVFGREGGGGGSQVARVYIFGGVVLSALIWLCIRGALALVPPNLRLGDTFAAIAQHHAAGSAILCALLAIGHSSFDALRARPFREWPARVVAVLVCLGLVGTSVTMYLLGAHGMPVRYASYLPVLTPYQRAVTIAAYAAAAALAMVPLAALLPRVKKSQPG